MKLVIVESPSKAKTIEKYLGKDYKVLASYGHVRQMPSKNGSVDTENKFTIIWEESPQAKKHLKEISTAAKQSKEIYLATDPDREGEAISWHLNNYLNEKKIIDKNHVVKRVVFNAITKECIQDAFQKVRDIDSRLVSAYLARTSLDYLVGFNISPILWHKLPGSRSAGRVQSVALRLICEKENEREDFKIDEYWQIEALLEEDLNKDNSFKAKLHIFDNKKLEKLSIKSKEEAENISNSIVNAKGYFVKEVIKKQIKKNPHAPFTTSSLQQDSFNKLGFTAKKTMTIAQKLYEGVTINKHTLGLITYMRTDAIDIVSSFITEIRNYIQSSIGKDYLSSSIRVYKTKAKNAQEAHEAIRPTQINMPPERVKSCLTEDEYKLYNLIWKRTIASQMSSAKYSNTSITIPNTDSSIVLKASGSILEFDGFYKSYGNIKENIENTLPDIKEGNKINCTKAVPSQHFTEPPARYSEASLVKTLEELGIGRPSTYASIISVLVNRKYAYIENKRFHPEERGRILNSFLTKFFSKYVDYDFTAHMEEDLDRVSRGDSTFVDLLTNFWQEFNQKVKEAKNISPNDILEALNSSLSDRFIGKDKTCTTCGKGNLLIKYSKFGAFIACSLYPECKHIKQLTVKEDSDSSEGNKSTDKIKDTVLKEDYKTGQKISLKVGPYGPYIESTGEKNKIKRTAIPKDIDPKNITLEQAEFLASLPKKIGSSITLSIGRFGPYLTKDKAFYSIKKQNIFTLTEEQANEIIQEQIIKKQGITLGINPKTKKTITLHSARFGPYLLHGDQKVKLAKEYKNKEISLGDALAVINQAKI